MTCTATLCVLAAIYFASVDANGLVLLALGAALILVI